LEIIIISDRHRKPEVWLNPHAVKRMYASQTLQSFASALNRSLL
jgi:hypothetical protein